MKSVLREYVGRPTIGTGFAQPLRCQPTVAYAEQYVSIQGQQCPRLEAT